MSILSTKAVLAALNVGGWNARKRDDAASNVVHEHYHATKDSGNFNKTLIDVKDESWVRITKARTALREYHYAHTLPWAAKGSQLLVAAMYLEFNSDIRKLIEEYDNAAMEFVRSNYERLKLDAKKKRNGLYHEADYPSAAELARKFYAEVRFLPVPDAGHVIVDLQNAEVDRIKADTEAMIEQAVAEAQAAVWSRLYEPVAAMAAALVNPDKRFHDTLVSNVKDIVKMAPAMNLNNDPNLTAMVAEVKRLTKTGAETLRTDPERRAVQAKMAADLVKKMSSLMPRIP